jgi:hypothetical protein
MGLCKSKIIKPKTKNVIVTDFVVDDNCYLEDLDELQCKHDVTLFYNIGTKDKSRINNKSIYNLYKAFGKEIPNHFQKIEN